MQHTKAVMKGRTQSFFMIDKLRKLKLLSVCQDKDGPPLNTGLIHKPTVRQE